VNRRAVSETSACTNATATLRSKPRKPSRQRHLNRYRGVFHAHNPTRRRSTHLGNNPNKTPCAAKQRGSSSPSIADPRDSQTISPIASAGNLWPRPHTGWPADGRETCAKGPQHVPADGLADDLPATTEREMPRHQPSAVVTALRGISTKRISRDDACGKAGENRRPMPKPCARISLKFGLAI
jgi:hypothetical protein